MVDKGKPKADRLITLKRYRILEPMIAPKIRAR